MSGNAKAKKEKSISFGENQTIIIPNIPWEEGTPSEEGSWQPVVRKHRRKARTRKRGKRKGRKVHLLSVSNHEQAAKVRGALADRGANGGVAGADTRVTQASGRCADITGIDNHKIKNA